MKPIRIFVFNGEIEVEHFKNFLFDYNTYYMPTVGLEITSRKFGVRRITRVIHITGCEDADYETVFIAV